MRFVNINYLRKKRKQHMRLEESLFIQGTALLMMIELVKCVISHAHASVFYFVLNVSSGLSACFTVCLFILRSICEVQIRSMLEGILFGSLGLFSFVGASEKSLP